MSNIHGSNIEKKRNANYAIAGAVSGAFTRAMTQPLDVLKIRFQLQTEPISRKAITSKYRGFFQAINLILHEEGLRALWRGHMAAQMLSITYGLVQFQVYEVLKNKSAEFKSTNGYATEKRSGIYFLCGGVAGIMATITSFPFDIVRTRLIAQGNNRLYTGIIHGLRSIYQQEGLLSCWRGLTPALVVAGPFIGFQFAFYEFFKTAVVYFDVFTSKSSAVEDSNKGKEANPFGNLLSGSLAGIASKTITYPFDLARKRMQIQNFQHARIGFGSNFWCTGLIVCFITTYRNESFLGMYKGLFPSLTKASLNTALHFAIYEETLRFLNKYNR